MGKRNENELIEFYGDRKSMIQNMLVYIQEKIDNDQILDYAKKLQDKTESYR